MSLVGKVRKEETYMAKNIGNGWETTITYPIFYYSQSTFNGDLSRFFLDANFVDSTCSLVKKMVLEL